MSGALNLGLLNTPLQEKAARARSESRVVTEAEGGSARFQIKTSVSRVPRIACKIGQFVRVRAGALSWLEVHAFVAIWRIIIEK